jgi:hypothetical protein
MVNRVAVTVNGNAEKIDLGRTHGQLGDASVGGVDLENSSLLNHSADRSTGILVKQL